MKTPQQQKTSAPLSDAERRQITVLFSDLIDSTRLAERLDPEDFSDLIVAYRRTAAAAIEKHGGFVARYLGDGILAYWGYPRAREQDPRRAVAAGLALVAGVAELNRTGPIAGIQLAVRVAIESGVVVVGQLGTSAASAADVVGEAPVIAARLQQLAEPNTVLVTENVRRLVERQFQFGSPRTCELKGISARVLAYPVLGQRTDPDHPRTRSDRVYGREAEQAMLDSCWRDVAAGRGQTILVTGEPGIGKTALVGQLRRTAAASGGACLHTDCFEEGIHTPLGPIRDILRQAVGVGPHDDLSKMRAKLNAIATPDGLHRDAVDKFLLPLLDPGSTDLTLANLAERRQRTTAFLADWLQTIVGQLPFLIVVEDIHWADPTSLDFLGRLAARAAATRLCLVLTSRTGFETTWIVRDDVSRLAVRSLHDDAVEALVAGMAREDILDVSMRRAIAVRAEGNPLFAEELVLLALQARIGGRSGDVLTLPSSLNDSLLARLDDLGELRPVALAAAVLGREFDERILADVLDLSFVDLAPKLESLVAAGILVDLGVGLQASHSFKHSLIRDAAYKSLLKDRRSALHAKSADVLVSKYPLLAEAHPELVAQHYEESSQFGPSIAWWTKAGEQASRQSTAIDAIRLLERAYSLFGRLDDGGASVRRAEVLNLLGVQYIAAHGYASPSVERAFSEAVSLLEDRDEDAAAPLLFALWGLHVHAMVGADVPRALKTGVRILALAGTAGDADMTLQGHRLQGLASLLSGAHSEASRHYHEVLARYDPRSHEGHRFRYGGDPKVLSLAQLAWSDWIGGRIAQSERYATEAVEFARQLRHSHSEVYALGVNALRLLTAREFDCSAEATLEAHRLADKNGFSYWIAWCDVILAALERRIDPDRGRVLLASAIERYQRTGARQLVPYARALESECWLDLNRPREAMDAIAEAIGLVEATGVRLYEPELLRLGACAAYKLSDPSGDDYLTRSLELAQKQGARSFLLRTLTTRFTHNPSRSGGKGKVVRNSLKKVLYEMGEGCETPDTRVAHRLLTSDEAQPRLSP